MSEYTGMSERNISGASARRMWPELATGAIWLLALIVFWGMPVSHDVVWQLWIARHMNAGVGIYSWIMEVNPPLWYWMAQPIEHLSGATGIASATLLVAIVFGLIGLLLALTAALSSGQTTRYRAWMLGGALFALIWVFMSDFAQREHLALIGLLPYALLTARRAEGRTVHWGLALAVGLLVTPMVALKHYFVLAPVLLEAWLLWRQKKQWRPIRPETLTLAMGAVIYAVAVWVLTPQYLTDLVPLLRHFYGDMRSPLIGLLVNRMTLVLPVAAAYFWHFRREMTAPTQTIGIVALAFLLSFALQTKAWGYYMDPVVSSIILMFAAHLATRPSTPRLRWSEMAIIALVPLISMSSVLLEGPYRNPYKQAVDQLLAPAQPGDAAIMLTTRPSRIWPMVDEKGLIWPSRYFHFWMMQSVANVRASGVAPSPELAANIDRVRQETVADFLCTPPDILIDDAASVAGMGAPETAGFDILAFFMEEPKFAALMEAYEPYGRLGPFTAYKRVTDTPPPTGDCQTLLTQR